MNQKSILLFFSLFIFMVGFGQIAEDDPYGRDLDAMTLVKGGLIKINTVTYFYLMAL